MKMRMKMKRRMRLRMRMRMNMKIMIVETFKNVIAQECSSAGVARSKLTHQTTGIGPGKEGNAKGGVDLWSCQIKWPLA
eukprot:6214230-Karenia_brevis.AAC.1